MQDFVQAFRQTVTNTQQRLLALSERQSEARPGPGEWSAKEVLGHLVDSAANNHRRFVEAQAKDDLVFPSYDQLHWVTAQQYQQAVWTDLVALWKAYNIHLAHVIAAIPHDVLIQPRTENSFERLARQAASEGKPVTLEYLIRDYYEHMKMHLEQLFAACGNSR
jgi:hypothetical protein